ncbi:NAD-dependent epimerase/dehydratase family protein [Pedobacter sp.]|uniref:NAD-dependent epimerase/dehydratase family protein n=1 Tax=Pedobacter sp. TaxID=1411316 RepID=UPI003BA845B6
MSGNKVFLTGATGLVGTSLTHALLSNGFHLTATSRVEKANTDRIHWVKNNFKDLDLNLRKYLANIDIIIHNGAAINNGKTIEEIDELNFVNIEFTKKLLNAASEFDIKKIIFTSSFSLIQKPLPELITETTKVEAGTPYSKSKYIAEELLHEHAQKYNRNYSICRISSPVSFDVDLMPDTVVKRWISQSKAKQSLQIYGKGQRRQDFVSVMDIAQAYIKCITNLNASGTFNIASGSTISMTELAMIISNHFGNDYFYGNQDVDENDKWNISIEKAKQQLGYSPKYSSAELISTLLNNLNS